MSNSATDRTDRKRNLEYDNWPVRRYDEYESWPVERASPDGQSVRSGEIEWVGTLAPGGGADLSSTNDEAIYEGRIDVANQRIVVGEEAAERDVSEASLADRIAEIGDQRDWGWLSSFARDHLDAGAGDTDHEGTEYHAPEGFDHLDTSFQRRNLPRSADAEVAFFGSHTYSDGTGRVHVLEREFDVDLPDATADATVSARVSVTEEYLVAADESAENREGEAERVDEREYEVAVEVGPDAPSRQTRVEGYLREWHAERPGTPVHPDTSSDDATAVE